MKTRLTFENDAAYPAKLICGTLLSKGFEYTFDECPGGSGDEMLDCIR